MKFANLAMLNEVIIETICSQFVTKSDLIVNKNREKNQIQQSFQTLCK